MPPVKYFTVTLLQKSMDECVIKKKKILGVPFTAQWLTNATSIQEDADLIPSLAQWVKDLALPWAVV